MGKDSHNNVFFRPILLSRKKATGPAQAAPKGNKGPIQSAAKSLTPLRSQSPLQLSFFTFGRTGDDQAIPVPQPKDPKVAERWREMFHNDILAILIVGKKSLKLLPKFLLHIT